MGNKLGNSGHNQFCMTLIEEKIELIHKKYCGMEYKHIKSKDKGRNKQRKKY